MTSITSVIGQEIVQYVAIDGPKRDFRPVSEKCAVIVLERRRCTRAVTSGHAWLIVDKLHALHLSGSYERLIQDRDYFERAVSVAELARFLNTASQTK